MKISEKSLIKIAEMVCGAHGTGGGYHWENFIYRSAPLIAEFFTEIGLPDRSSIAARKQWVLEVLQRENATVSSNPHLPADTIILLLQELFSARTYEERKLDRAAALADLNDVIKWDGLRGFFDEEGRLQLEATGTGAKSVGTLFQVRRAWTEEEQKQRKAFASFLDCASEDAITEELLVPLFLHLGFERIVVAGHKDKKLEYGNDLWMKLRLPTRHSLYFGCQIKRDKIDAGGKSDANIAAIHNQILMMLDYAIWDPETNRKHLLDHAYLISGGEITKQAKNWLGHHLDDSKRRQIMFMDRMELIDLAVANRIALPKIADPDDVPF